MPKAKEKTFPSSVLSTERNVYGVTSAGLAVCNSPTGEVEIPVTILDVMEVRLRAVRPNLYMKHGPKFKSDSLYRETAKWMQMAMENI